MDMLRSLQVLPMTLDVLQVSPVHDYNISKLISIGGGGCSKSGADIPGSSPLYTSLLISSEISHRYLCQ